MKLSTWSIIFFPSNLRRKWKLGNWIWEESYKIYIHFSIIPHTNKDIIVIYSSSIYFFILVITYTRWRHAKCLSFLFWGKIKVIYKLFIKALRYILKEKWYVHNIFTIFLQQILSGRLLLVVIVMAKSNLSVRFKFEPITTNHLWFIMKIL